MVGQLPVQGWLRNGRPFYGVEARTIFARILDDDQLQIAVLQQVNLICEVGVVIATTAPLDVLRKHLRPLKPGLENSVWAVHDQVWVRRTVPGPILKEVELPLSTDALALVGGPGDVLKGGDRAGFCLAPSAAGCQ